MESLETIISTGKQVSVEYTVEKGMKGDGIITPDDDTEFDIHKVYAPDSKGSFVIPLDIHTLQEIGIMDELRTTIAEEINN